MFASVLLCVKVFSFMNELSPQQIAILERIITHGFHVAAFPLYANAVGIRSGNYAALLDPISGGGFRLYGEPCMLLDGNLTVRLTDKGRLWFVWKKQRIEATPQRLSELGGFVTELKLLIEPHV
jgi:hypothetical protein